MPRIIPPYCPRFVTDAQLGELVELWHLARTGLAGNKPPGSEFSEVPKTHDRMLWAVRHFHQSHPEISESGAYKDLDGALFT